MSEEIRLTKGELETLKGEASHLWNMMAPAVKENGGLAFPAITSDRMASWCRMHILAERKRCVEVAKQYRVPPASAGCTVEAEKREVVGGIAAAIAQGDGNA